MSDRTLDILKSRRFLPLFATQFLGAFNDNLFKNALVVLVLFRIAADEGGRGEMLAAAAAGLFVLPFFLFSATAGQLADKYDKARMIRGVKLAEVAIMLLAALGFAWERTDFLFVVLFLMGIQSAFFGPLKYGILPQHLDTKELVGGNALIEAATFLAILLGTIAGGLLILADGGVTVISGGIIVVALLGWAASLMIPAAPAPAPQLKVNWNFVWETGEILRHAAARRDIFLSILGISWFWLVGLSFLALFGPYAKNVLGGDEQVITLFLTVFSIGIGVGSIGCDRLLKGEVSARTVPFGALGMAVFSIDLYFASLAAQPAVPPEVLAGVGTFLAQAAHWRILADLLLISICGGLYIVPLYAIVQARAEPEHRARTIAANNVMNALFMVIGAGAAAVLFALGMTVTGVFLIIAGANVIAAWYVCKLLPQELLKGIFAAVFRLFFRVELHGRENIRAAGDKAVIVVNHVSFLDGALLAAFLPGRPMFAIDSHMATRWWVRPFMALVEGFPMDPTSPFATRALIREVEKGKHCVIFPEGRITVTGALMKVYEGPGMIADKSGAQILPVRIDGAQFSYFSRLKGKFRLSLFPKITITVLPPRHFEIPAEARGRKRRQLSGDALYEVMSDMMFRIHHQEPRTLFQALLEARSLHGGGKPAVEDIERKPLTYDRLLTGALVLGRHMAKGSRRGDVVGLMLPSASGAAVSFFALQAFGRVPAMLNFTAGSANLISACKTAEIETVYTSRRFVEQAKLEQVAEALSKEVKLVYLEDLRREIGFFSKLYGLVLRPFAGALHARACGATGLDPAAPALVLFTSGSEGTPKGVVLSHDNLLANCRQLAARIDFNPTDSVFNALPVFHSFGLTGGLLLPLFSGVKTFMYPSPLHYRIVPVLAYDTNATIMFGTDTFLAGYARMAHPYDFYAMRYVFAGAERVREETRRLWMEKFGLRILEGYGATECAPVIAVNSPMHFKAGTVGRLLPGLHHRLEPVPGVAEGGRLLVAGPNVMLGYLKAENPGALERPEDGWYDTGDIVDIDAEGYVTILGRAKRFAKVAGEMISLGAVENLVSALWPDEMHAVVALPDARKGEQLVLLTEREGAKREEISAYARAEGASELAVPRQIFCIDKLPLLGSGKVDYPAAKVLAEQFVGGPVGAA
ncbi:acyl-[ACP]--phospholipid O-acyltransferase [Pelagibius marinus]|uniref:acyl-[ACP]--phospholipid O-acyltransferase n=1 Tax=Pelagibius marinus TaxID=2762760 RepID=UPI001872A18C|nr:acyl-[ACP]--phospholipid O-acyltransferase [Pelagibius marinus]